MPSWPNAARAMTRCASSSPRHLRQRAAEERQQLSAKLFRLHEGLLITDANTVLDLIHFLLITGYTREEMLGSVPAIMQAGGCRLECGAAAGDGPRRARAERQLARRDHGCRRSGGRTLQVTISAVRGGNGQIRFHAGRCRTSRRRRRSASSSAAGAHRRAHRSA
jgi:hypothetical protein